MYEIVKIYDLDPVTPKGEQEEPLMFRLEVMRNCSAKGYYTVRLFRRESFRLRLSFPSLNPDIEECDEEILISDIFDDLESIKEATIEEAIKKMNNIFMGKYGINLIENNSNQ